MDSIDSLTLIGQADEAMSAGNHREAGRLALEAADAVETPAEVDALADFAEEAIPRCSFMQRGRFEAVLEHLEERRAELAASPQATSIT